MSPNRIHILRRSIAGLILFMGLSCMSLSSKADQWGDWMYTVSGSNVTITGYGGTGGDIVIPDAISNMPVTAIGDSAFYNRGFASVALGTNVVVIGVHAFENCHDLTKMIIPDSVVDIRDRAFLGCALLQSLVVGSSVTNIGNEAFAYATGLRNITVSDSVTTIGSNCFSGCNFLTNAFLGNSVTAIGSGAFCDCHDLLEITIPDSVISMGREIFINCDGLTNVVIGNGVTNIEVSSFDYCTHLVSVEMGAGIVSIADFTFDNCWALSLCVLPPTLVNIGEGAFHNCASLPSVVIPATVTNIGKYAFSGCNALSDVTVPPGITSLPDGVFSDSYGLTKVLFQGDAPSSLGSLVFWSTQATIYYYPWMAGWTNTFGGRPTVPMDISYALNDGAVTITGYTGTNSFLPIPNTISNLPVVAIGDYAFHNNEILARVMIPDSVLNIGELAFGYCSSFVSVTIGNSVTNIGDMAFDECVSLTNFTIPDSVISIGTCSFYGCESLTSVTIPNNVKSVWYNAFFGCTSLTNVILGSGITILGGTAFGCCPSLTSITVDAHHPLLSSLDGVMFNKNKTRLYICPGGKAGSYAIPEGVVDVGVEAFYYCNSLTNVTIPSTVTRFFELAFISCSNLMGVYFKGDSPVVYLPVFTADDNLTVYYYPWTSGWTDNLGGRPTQVNPAYTQWLLDHSFATNRTEDATDYDKDGMLNWQEYLAHTDPKTNADFLAITSMGSETSLGQIAWLAKSNVTYQVMKSSDLMGAWGSAPSGLGADQQSQQTAIMDGILQYADPGYAGATNAFYRVSVVP